MKCYRRIAVLDRAGRAAGDQGCRQRRETAPPGSRLVMLMRRPMVLDCARVRVEYGKIRLPGHYRMLICFYNF